MKVLLVFYSTLAVAFLSPEAFGQASRTNAADDYEDSTWVIGFGGAYSSRIIQHSETSSIASYTTSGRRIRVPDVKMSLYFMKELLNPNRISVTASLFGGVADSDGKSAGEGIDTFREKLSGFHMGGGLSVNYNTYSYGLKLQPYVGVRVIQDQGELSMAHTDGTRRLTTVHEYEAQIAHLGIGVRAFDADYSLMSFFEISTPQKLSEELTASGFVEETSVDVASTTTVERDVWSISLGFGYFF